MFVIKLNKSQSQGIRLHLDQLNVDLVGKVDIRGGGEGQAPSAPPPNRMLSRTAKN